MQESISSKSHRERAVVISDNARYLNPCCSARAEAAFAARAGLAGAELLPLTGRDFPGRIPPLGRFSRTAAASPAAAGARAGGCCAVWPRCHLLGQRKARGRATRGVCPWPGLGEQRDGLAL